MELTKDKRQMTKDHRSKTKDTDTSMLIREFGSVSTTYPAEPPKEILNKLNGSGNRNVIG
jgi:hypothetical protein